MSTRKHELSYLFENIKFRIAHECDIKGDLNECHQRTLEVVRQLEHSLDIARKVTDAQYEKIAKAQDEARELRTRLESKNKTLGLVVMALAETIGEQER